MLGSRKSDCGWLTLTHPRCSAVIFDLSRPRWRLTQCRSAERFSKFFERNRRNRRNPHSVFRSCYMIGKSDQQHRKTKVEICQGSQQKQLSLCSYHPVLSWMVAVS